MSDKQFSHVCTACRTPVLLAQPKKSSSDWLILAAGPIGGAVVLSALVSPAAYSQHHSLGNLLVFAVLGFVVAYIGVSYLVRKRARICPSCHSETLIPVGSPEGLRIMKEAGLVES